MGLVLSSITGVVSLALLCRSPAFLLFRLASPNFATTLSVVDNDGLKKGWSAVWFQVVRVTDSRGLGCFLVFHLFLRVVNSGC